MMKQITLVALLSITVHAINAQSTHDGLLKAERNFASYCVINGIKDAFLKFLDSTGIVFDNGKAVNGIESWSKKEKGAGILNWYPRYSDISHSNDFGFTTGPWTFRQTLQDSVIASGHYTTIWHIDKNGEWKFLLDLGVENNPLGFYASADTILGVENFSSVTGTLKSLVQKEKEFIRETQKANYHHEPRKYWYDKSKSFMAVLNRNNRMPAMFTDMILGVLNSMPETIDYEITGSGIAPSGDMGYVYGTTIINGKKDNYLRIWRIEAGGWRIALEVLRY